MEEVQTVGADMEKLIEAGLRNAREALDRADLEAKVKGVYRQVALAPEGKYHFELGRSLAERLGYPVPLLDAIPAGAIESFAGVGYFFDLAGLSPGERVLDLGSGSGTDVFAAAVSVGASGSVVGLDMTPEQLRKASGFLKGGAFPNVDFRQGHIEELPFEDASFDVVISNGAINLSPDKAAVFREAERVLRKGGRLVFADIVTSRPLTPQIVCDADLWAACVGGAEQIDVYQQLIADSGLRLGERKRNPYEFLSGRARNATDRFGVMSLSFAATKD
ncbi:methyltransferase domain-containing protein [Arthrobacter sp. R4-81]